MNNAAPRQTHHELTAINGTACFPPMSPLGSRIRAFTAVAARSPFAHRMLAALLLAGLPGIGAYAYFVEPVWLRVKRLTLPLPNLPLHFDGLRIVHLSDLH